MDSKDEGMIKMQDFQQWFGGIPTDTMISSPTEPHDQTTADADDEVGQLWNDPSPISFHLDQPVTQDVPSGSFHSEPHSTQQFASAGPVAPQPVPSPLPRPSSTAAPPNMQIYPAIPVTNGAVGNAQPQLNTAIQPTYYSNGSSYTTPVSHYPQTAGHASPPGAVNGTSYSTSYMAYGSGMSPTQVWQSNGAMVYAPNGQSHAAPATPIDTMLANAASPPPAQTTTPIYPQTAYANSPPVSSATPQPQAQHASYTYNWTPEQLRAIQQQQQLPPIPTASGQQRPYRATVVPVPQPQHARVQQTQSASPMPTMSPRMMHMSGSPVPYPNAYGDMFNSGVSSPYSHAQSNPASINPQALSQPAPSTSTPTLKPQANTIHLYKQYMQPQMMDQAPVQTAKNLINVLTAEKTPETDPETRLWLLTRIRDGAGKDFFKTWANDAEGMMLIKEWLRAATPSKDGKAEPGSDPAEWQETIMPLLQVIDRLPLGINQLRKSKIGSNVLKLAKNPPNGAIRDLASSLENRYRQLMETHQTAAADDGKGAGGKRTEAEVRGVKRKLDTPPLKTAAPAKRPTPAPAAAVAARLVAAKKEKEKAGGPVTKETKSDSSFFTDTKPKPAPVKRVLPSFTKKSTPPAADVAQPSNRNTFEEALAHMGVKPKASTPTVPEPMEGITPTDSRVPPKDPSKKRKRVTFKPEEHLVEVRWIEKAIYDGDEDTPGAHHNLRDLDRDEGAAMHKHLIFEELIDWSEPMALFLPDSQLAERGKESQEAATQAEREKTALLAHYLPGETPPSPAELPASHPIGDDAQTKTMLAGEDIDSLSEKPVSVAELLAKMGGPPANPETTTEPTAPMFGSLKDLGIDPNTFTQMLQQHNIAPVLAPPEPAPAPVQHGPGPDWGGNSGGGRDDGYGPSSYYDDHPRSRYEDRGGRGGRGRGRGRGRPDNDRGQKVCYFYPLGKCKYGDQCHNLHI
ncbi:hypothetical protein FS749_015621 [Ceratobasidium sp. UAMH 11750]|nr:hypothetical protein FS749_015621 [Ceratobasidium sp. UAMH 11750]